MNSLAALSLLLKIIFSSQVKGEHFLKNNKKVVFLLTVRRRFCL